MSFISQTRTLGGLYRYGAAEFIYDPEGAAARLLYVADEIRGRLPADGVRRIEVTASPLAGGRPAPDWWGLSPTGAARVRLPALPLGARFDPNFPTDATLSTAGLPGDPADALAALVDLMARGPAGWRNLVEVTCRAPVAPAALSRVAAATGAAVLSFVPTRTRGALVCRSKMLGSSDLDLREVITITRAGGAVVASLEIERGSPVSIMIGGESWSRPILRERDPGYAFGSLRAQYADRWERRSR